MRSLTLAFILLSFTLSLVATALAEDAECTTRRDGRLYDLRPLKSKKDYKFKSPSGAEFRLNICRPLVDDLWNVKVPKSEEVGGAVRRAHGDFSLGTANTTLDVRAGSPVLTLTGGSECTGDAKGMHGSTVVRFICDSGFGGATGEGAGKGQPQLIAQIPAVDEDACTYVIEWKTQYACPTDESWSFWSIIFTIGLALIGVLILYILVGAYYRRRSLHLRGMDTLPPLTSVHAADTLRFCRDAVEDLWSRRSDPFDRYGSAWSGWDVRNGGPRPQARAAGDAGGGGRATAQRRGGYEQVAADRSEVEAILGDDSEEEDDDEQPPRDVEANRRPSAAPPAQPTQAAAASTPPRAAARAPAASTPAARPQGMDDGGVIRL